MRTVISRAIFDTNMYIAHMRQPDVYGSLFASYFHPHLSLIVLVELYYGANPSEKRALHRRERDAARRGTLVVPTRTDYTDLAEILRRLRGTLDTNQRRIVFDVLIALAAHRKNALLITEDRHFEGIQAVMRPFRDFQLAIADRASRTLQRIR